MRRAPWMKNIWFWGDSYIIPNIDTVVLGGTAGKGDWNTVPTLSETARILNDVCELFPAFKNIMLVRQYTYLLFINFLFLLRLLNANSKF